jgi:hypothetical protein
MWWWWWGGGGGQGSALKGFPSAPTKRACPASKARPVAASARARPWHPPALTMMFRPHSCASLNSPSSTQAKHTCTARTACLRPPRHTARHALTCPDIRLAPPAPPPPPSPGSSCCQVLVLLPARPLARPSRQLPSPTHLLPGLGAVGFPGGVDRLLEAVQAHERAGQAAPVGDVGEQQAGGLVQALLEAPAASSGEGGGAAGADTRADELAGQAGRPQGRGSMCVGAHPGGRGGGGEEAQPTHSAVLCPPPARPAAGTPPHLSPTACRLAWCALCTKVSISPRLLVLA